MKKVILIFGVVLLSGVSYAQKVSESEVPSNVKAKFTSRYPNTKVDKWKKENGNYEAEFDQNKKEMTAVIDPSGKLLHTKEKIDDSSLPNPINDYVKKNYDDKKISEPRRITDPSGKIMYEIEVDENYLMFDSNGGFIRSYKEKKEKKEK